MSAARIAGVVLAAGASRRAGTSKAIATIGGETLVARVVRTLREAGCAPVIVVVGAPHEDRVRAEAERAGARTVRNDDPERGMSSSLQLALAALAADTDAAVIALVDHPRVEAATVRALADAFRAHGTPRIRPTHAGRAGHPYLVGRAAFAPLLALAPDAPEGARPVLRALATREVPVGDPAIHDDLDTPEALAAAGVTPAST